MITIKVHSSFIGRPSPKSFRFHYFRLRYPSKGETPRLLTKDFTGQGSPIVALSRMRDFMEKKGLLKKGVSAKFDETFDAMLASNCGYARVQDADGKLQIMPTVSRLTIRPMEALYRIVGGLSDKGARIDAEIVNDAPRFERGSIVGDKVAEVPAHLLGLLHPLDESEARGSGLAMGWKVYVLADSVRVGRRIMSDYLKGYAQKRLAYWEEVLNYVAPEMREA